MLLEDIAVSPHAARRYMERFVNDGSPSGFTLRYTTSPATSPFGPTAEFPLLATRLGPDRLEDLGRLPQWLRADELLLHPDMASDAILASNGLAIEPTEIRVVPTASARTVEALEPSPTTFIKLSYRALLGRVERQISRAHALSALDITELLERAVEKRALPTMVAFLRESGARVATLKTAAAGNYEWATVFREIEPYPPHAATAFLIPVFSLFGHDKYRPNDPLLLTQLINSQRLPVNDYVFTQILSPIVSCYFDLLLTCAMQFECNAQNLLLGFDSHCLTTCVVFRDFESVDKDLSLVEERGLPIIFRSAPFKCVHRGLYNYSIKHSFMYDFKLGEYVLTPLIQVAMRAGAGRDLVARTKNLGRTYVQRLPSSFFPSDGLWYSYANVVVDKTTKRPYVGKPDPQYR